MKNILLLLLCVLPLWAQGAAASTQQNDIAMPLSQAVTLGAIQGMTEFLPVSSTGHMILANHYIFHVPEAQKDSWNDYLVCIQLGTILTLLLFYRRDIGRILRGCCGKDTDGFRLGWNVGLAFVPAGLLGFFCDGYIQQKLYNPLCIAWALAIGGYFISLIESWRVKHAPRYASVYNLTARSALAIGLCQCIALWPGFSRSLATIIGSLLVGLSLVESIRFSFLLGLLTSTVATLYKLLKHSDALLHMLSQSMAWVGIGVAFVLGLLTIHLFLRYLQRHGLKIFGYYRILLAIILTIS